MKRVSLICALAMLVIAGGGLIPTPAQAGATLLVDTTADIVALDGLCSLREAVIAANTDSAFSDCPTGSGADTIQFSPSLPSPAILTLTASGAGEDAAQTGDLDVTGKLTISGSGTAATILDGNASDRVLEILPGAQVTVTNVTVRNGNPGTGQEGGGILVNLTASLTMTNTVVTGSAALRGGGVKVLGMLTASDSLIDGNQGGGVENDGGSINFTNVDITDSTSGYGVRNRNQGVLTYNGGLVDGNLGGGIYNDRGTASLTSLTITNNTNGGGVHNTGAITANLTLTQSTVMSNTASSGAGIFNSGLGTVVHIDETRISANQASLAGGGVYNSGLMTIESSTIDQNQARSGGGVDHRGGTLHMTNDTISGNSVSDNGGGIHNAFGIFLTNVTLVANTAQGNGGGIFNNEANAYPKNTVIAANQAADGNCANSEFANVVSQGHNLADDDTCNLTATGDISNQDPMLGPLQDNGGATPTHALLAGSPAINAGDNSGCPSTDQRGVDRPQGAVCDIGSYERILGGEANLSLSKTDAFDPVTVGEPITYTLTVDNGGPDGAQNVTLTDTLPGSVTFLSAAPDQGSCGQAGGVVTCHLGDIPNGASASVQIVVGTTAAGALTNNASVSADTGDPTPGDNNASEMTTVNSPPGPQANLGLTKVDALDPVTVGEPITYTLTVDNGGPDGAQNVTLTDTLPGSVTFLSAASDQGSCGQAGGVVTCHLGDMPNGASVSVQVVVGTTAAGDLTNNASVSADTGDPTPGDNNASETTTVEPQVPYTSGDIYLPLIMTGSG